MQNQLPDKIDKDYIAELAEIFTIEELYELFSDPKFDKVRFLNEHQRVKNLDLEEVSDTVEDYMDVSGIGIESIVFRMQDRRLVEVLVLKALGFRPKEIAATLSYDSVGSFYQLNFRLKREWERIIKELDKE